MTIEKSPLDSSVLSTLEDLSDDTQNNILKSENKSSVLPPLESISLNNMNSDNRGQNKLSSLPPIENITLDDMDTNEQHTEKKSSVLPPLKDIHIEDINVNSIKTEDITTERTAASRAIADRMKRDDITLEMVEKPVLEDLSTEIKGTYDKDKAEAMYRPRPVAQPKSEKVLIKERLAREINNIPDNIDRKKSLELYNKLLEEKKEREAKKGATATLIVVLIGLACGGISFFLLSKAQPLFRYLAYATFFFSLLLLIKAKPCKILSSSFFGINTLVVIPGLINFIVQSEIKGFSLGLNIAYLAIETILSAIVCVQLCTSSKIEAYFTSAKK